MAQYADDRPRRDLTNSQGNHRRQSIAQEYPKQGMPSLESARHRFVGPMT
jgi:hypothetical protein